MNEALQTLQHGVDSLAPWLQADGELFDPVFDEPTQYGTAYYAYCNAVLAQQLGEQGGVYRERALRGLRAALNYVAHPELPPRASSAFRETGEVLGVNHRDFFWPPILKTYHILNELGDAQAQALASDISAVQVERSFAKRPPNNWAAVWLSGEWLRFREGLSPYAQEQIDNWLAPYFATHVRLDQGLYMEPGLPNSYDLFTRYHLADILLNGYQGRFREPLEHLMETGLLRSLQVQLSDGSLASAYRSTGQTWTDGAQCAYLRMAAHFFKERRPDLASRAAHAAGRAFSSLRRFQRPDAPFSPVENVLPPGFRVGYELYTADAHYSSLAMAFLATAILHDLEGASQEDLAPRSPSVRIEHDPTFRAIAHNGPYSLHINTSPSHEYDAFGIVDITFGPGRFLQFASSVRHLESGHIYNLGIAHREQPGRSPLMVVCQMQHDRTEPISTGEGSASLLVRSRPHGSPYPYDLSARLESGGIQVSESTPGLLSYKTLLIPYLRDPGTGHTTHVQIDGQVLRLELGDEAIQFAFQAPVDHVVHLPHGFENRRGLCGLLRVDFRDPLEAVDYQITILR